MTRATERDTKRAIRERVWERLRRDGASSDPHGRIPDFVGAAATAQQLAALPAWQQAHVIRPTLTRRSCRGGSARCARASWSIWPCPSWLDGWA
ncbi:MAG: hypothetical protein M3460_06980 [Actinomycetota bacterium]|nr:hypothetical protein [Actinomycetota bacterium]